MNVPNEIIRELRAMMPDYPVSHGEATVLAEHQAALLLKLLKVDSAPVDIYNIVELLGITVVMAPRHEMPSEGGITHSRGGHLGASEAEHTIQINQNDTVGRRRMTLGHELKHVLDDGLDERVYKGLGFGNQEVHDQLVEKVCDHFAAALLMPSKIVKRAWNSGITDPRALADLCNVSTSAMIRRLRYLGFSKEKPKPARHYFKRVLRRSAMQLHAFETTADTEERLLAEEAA